MPPVLLAPVSLPNQAQFFPHTSSPSQICLSSSLLSFPLPLILRPSFLVKLIPIFPIPLSSFSDLCAPSSAYWFPVVSSISLTDLPNFPNQLAQPLPESPHPALVPVSLLKQSQSPFPLTTPSLRLHAQSSPSLIFLPSPSPVFLSQSVPISLSRQSQVCLPQLPVTISLPASSPSLTKICCPNLVPLLSLVSLLSPLHLPQLVSSSM